MAGRGMVFINDGWTRQGSVGHGRARRGKIF